MAKFLLGLLLALLAVIAARAQYEGEECPAGCSCREQGSGPFVASCSQLEPTQRFGRKIARLIIENDNSLVLDTKIFQIVGLQNISTIRIRNCIFKKLDPRAFSSLKNLRFLHFESNNQMILHPDMFNETSNLKQLVLRNNKLKFLGDASYLLDINGLEELEISGADITKLSESSFSRMPQLRYIGLSSNRIKNIGHEFSSLEDLTEIDLSSNFIGEIQPNIFNKSQLQVLNLRNNSLTTLKGLQMPSIEELDLSLCKFHKVDKETFAGFTSVALLNLSGNAISELKADAFVNMSSLNHLDLSHNALEEPLREEVFQPLKQLQVLILAHNSKLNELPNNLFKGLGDLFRLDLSHCGLNEINSSLLQGLSSLTILNLAGNSLHNLKQGVLPKFVAQLDISHNDILLLEELNFPLESRLKKLNLAGNRLVSVGTFYLSQLHDLQNLDLSSCGLDTFWELSNKPPQLESLEILSLAKNDIRFLTVQHLELMPKLAFLDITGNPLNCDDTLSSTFKWFKDNDFRANIHDMDIQIVLSTTSYPDVESIGSRGWSEAEVFFCGQKSEMKQIKDNGLGSPEKADEAEAEDDESEDDLDDEDQDADDEDDEDDDDDDDEVEDVEVGYSDEPPMLDIRQTPVLRGESDDGYLWTVLIVAMTAAAVLFSLTILAAFILRWSRQRNSYGAQMIKNLNTPKMRRDRSSIYQQLYEDPNHPTTPVMAAKHPNQTHYSFPEAPGGGRQAGYMIYLPKDYHDSTVIPESV